MQSTMTFPNLSAIEGVRHCIFSRRGGVSRGAYESLNVCMGVGDEETSVLQNREKVRAYVKADFLAFAEQVHGDEVLILDRVSFSWKEAGYCHAGAGDAMITNIPGAALVIQIADCQSVMMADPIQRVVANVHVGWRGNAQNIIGRTIEKMNERFGCTPSNLQVGISPSLGPCCAEYVNYKKELPEAFWRFKDRQDRFDFWAISSQQLMRAGVPEANLRVSGVCTKCHTERYFSYRARPITGRFASVIGLKD